MSEKTMILKPCPFCGTKLSEFPEVMIISPVRSDEYLLAKIEHKQIIGSDAGYAVKCIKCSATGSRGMSRDEAAEKWNMRADDGSYVDKLSWDGGADDDIRPSAESVTGFDSRPQGTDG